MTPTQSQLDEALRYMRVPREGFEANRPLAERGFAALSPLARPRTVWRTFAFRARGEEIEIDGETLCRSSSLARLFAGCRACAAMAVTLGPEVDRAVRLLAMSDVSAASALDACASVWADSLCGGVEREIERTLPPGAFLTPRFSPGYGDVPMSVTSDLLRLLDAGRRIGLTLSRGGMMVPVKSVTALVGIADGPLEKRRGRDGCALRDCPYRDNEGVCHGK